MRYEDDDEDEGPKADASVEAGMPLPIRLAAVFPPELACVPIEDIDPYYRNQRVSVFLLFFFFFWCFFLLLSFALVLHPCTVNWSA